MNSDQYFAYFKNSWRDETPVGDVRYVVLDSETTGLDAKRDRLITIGAVAVQDGEIRLDDSFEALLKMDYNRSSVTVHGITRDEAQAGLDEPAALELFLDYLRDGVIVGHHIGHDIRMLNAAYERHFQMQLLNRALDTMDLTLHLDDDGAFKESEMAKEFTLDALCDMFGVIPHDRHTAGGDAFITAQIFLRLLKYAAKAGRTTLGAISIPYTTHE